MSIELNRYAQGYLESGKSKNQNPVHAVPCPTREHELACMFLTAAQSLETIIPKDFNEGVHCYIWTSLTAAQAMLD